MLWSDEMKIKLLKTKTFLYVWPETNNGSGDLVGARGIINKYAIKKLKMGHHCLFQEIIDQKKKKWKHFRQKDAWKVISALVLVSAAMVIL